MIKDIKDKYFKKLYLKESRVCGMGLFAAEKIETGQIILIFGGNISVSQDRYNGKFLRSTCIGITEGLFLGECVQSTKEKADYINHSCDPNAGLEDAITLIAIRDIEAGEEILCDYVIWEDDENWEMKNCCNCGASNCRRKICGTDWKNIRSGDVIFNYCSPFIKRKILANEARIF